MVKDRTGEKIGWIGGWLGGFIWVLLLSVFLLIQGRQVEGIFGLVLECIAIVVILWTVPWKHPRTVYWKLLIPIYVTLFVSVMWAFWVLGGAEGLGLNWWNVLWIFPLLIPLGTIGKRRWDDCAT